MTHRIATELRHIAELEQKTHELGHEYITARDGSVVADPAGGLVPRSQTIADALRAIPLQPMASFGETPRSNPVIPSNRECRCCPEGACVLHGGKF